MYSNPAQDLIAGFFAMIVIGYLIYAFLVVLPFWLIFKKAGYSGALSLLLLIPVVGGIIVYVIAFSDWPVLREVRQWRDWHRSQQPPAQQPPAQQ